MTGSPIFAGIVLLLALGADEVIPEEFETSIEIFRCVPRSLHVPPGCIAVQAALIRREGYRLLSGARGVEEGLESLHTMLRETLVDSMAVLPHSAVAGTPDGIESSRAILSGAPPGGGTDEPRVR